MSDNLQDVVFDDTTETEGFRAYKAGLKAGAAAERERIRQLAIEKRAIFFTCTMQPCPDSHHGAMFADLLGPGAP